MGVHVVGDPWEERGGMLVGGGVGNELVAGYGVGAGPFRMRARLTLEEVDRTAASVELGWSSFGLDGAAAGGRLLFLAGPLFHGGHDGHGRVTHLGPTEEFVRGGEPFELEVSRSADTVEIRIDGALVHAQPFGGPLPRLALRPHRGRFHVAAWSLAGSLVPVPPPAPAAFTLPVVDLAADTARQVVVDREPGQYLGHVTTVLLEDGRTMLATYPKGHGRGAIVMKRSEDAGLTWGERLPLPENFASSKEVPTIHRVVDAGGVRRLILFSGLHPVRMSVSEDDGGTWTPLEPVGDWGGIVTMGCVEERAPFGNGRYLALFHDDGRFLDPPAEGEANPAGGFTVYQSTSEDGGLSWSRPRAIASHPAAHLCEPGILRSPDGGTLAVLLRENSRRFNSFLILSEDEGETWSEPRELPASLTGDRHTGRYAPDGRIFLTFRDTTRVSPTKGDWVGWVGTWDDIVHGREGAYRVRLMDNTHAADCAYPGLEVLGDGTFVATTYGHWEEGQEPFIVSVRFTLEELDRLLGREER